MPPLRKAGHARAASHLPQWHGSRCAGGFQTGVATGARPPHRGHPRTRAAARHLCAVCQGTQRRSPLSNLSSCPEAGGWVASWCPSAAAAAVGCRSRAGRCGRLWSRGDQRAPTWGANPRSRPLPRPRALLSGPFCQSPWSTLALWDATDPHERGSPGGGSPVDDGAVSLRAV